jgi:cytoskeleton protein RodZ
MEELGHILREAREARGFTLSQAQDKTRINLKYLEALENGEYAALPTPVHARGYLRNYARFLNLDPQPLLERYEASAGRHPASVSPSASPRAAVGPVLEQPIPTRDDQPFFVPANLEIGGGGGGERDAGSAMRWIIIIALFVAIFLVANRFIPLLTSGQDGTQALTEGSLSFIADLFRDAPEEEQQPVVAPPIETDSGRDIINTGAPVAAPTSETTRPTLPSVLETIQLRLEVTERSWMRVTIDGEIVFEGLARRGEGPFEWEARQEARFLTGNGAGVYVTINNIELGWLGERGEVIDEVWMTAR